ncbi:hypothetical protein Taro_056165 [Colocasia esculenta]|uniref:Uncharacterized protein n=1 Tax=Colocasia esculenta TaxID=4460 RepID=A0A843XVD9_COLES|nr:hypothetical protein [Colocasia esculenta]
MAMYVDVYFSKILCAADPEIPQFALLSDWGAVSNGSPIASTQKPQGPAYKNSLLRLEEISLSLWQRNPRAVRKPKASSGDLHRLEDSLDIRECFPDSGVQRDSPQSPELGGFGGFLALAEESFSDLLFPIIWLHAVDVVVYLLVMASGGEMSQGVRTRVSSRPQHPRVLCFLLHHQWIMECSCRV